MDAATYVVFCTVPPARAESLAEFLVDRRFAACVNILPTVRSVYRWDGRVARDDESLLVIKCPVAGFDALREALVREHPYDVPEVIALPVAQGHEPYLRWVHDEATGAGAEGST